MYALVQQTYRHLVQQAIVRQEMRSLRQAYKQGAAWEIGSITALFSAAALCGTLAQAHLG